jgi:hypothetical protein
MSKNIRWSLNVQVASGPNISMSQIVEVEAYDNIDVVVPGASVNPPAAGTKTVEVQPGGSGQVSFLLITSNMYDSKLTYKVVDDGDSEIKLDAPLLLVESGAVGLLGTKNNTFVFTNKIAKDVSINILVGRKATT